jgi:hypothetical protein
MRMPHRIAARKGTTAERRARKATKRTRPAFSRRSRNPKGESRRSTLRPWLLSQTERKAMRESAVMLRQEARRRELDRAGQVVFIGDGAAWVGENCRMTFPGAVEILDFYHASARMWASSPRPFTRRIPPGRRHAASDGAMT